MLASGWIVPSNVGCLGVEKPWISHGYRGCRVYHVYHVYQSVKSRGMAKVRLVSKPRGWVKIAVGRSLQPIQVHWRNNCIKYDYAEE